MEDARTDACRCVAVYRHLKHQTRQRAQIAHPSLGGPPLLYQHLLRLATHAPDELDERVVSRALHLASAICWPSDTSTTIVEANLARVMSIWRRRLIADGCTPRLRRWGASHVCVWRALWAGARPRHPQYTTLRGKVNDAVHLVDRRRATPLRWRSHAQAIIGAMPASVLSCAQRCGDAGASRGDTVMSYVSCVYRPASHATPSRSEPQRTQ